MNAKQEFIEETKDKKLVCARIGVDKDNYGMKIKWFTLRDNYSNKDFEVFCNRLDFEYDSGFGTQQLYGIILFEDSYSDRYEYDGSESWDNHKMPTIEEVLTPTTTK
jgi:hypothetical protein